MADKTAVHVILDGATGLKVGKSSLLHCLSDVYKASRRLYDRRCYYFEILNQSSVSLYYRSGVIIEVFAINDPRTLEEVINVRIPYIRTRSSFLPILLVGTKSDLRQKNNSPQSDLFPLAFGQFLANLFGAVKYVECSSKSGQDISQVLREAILASDERECFYYEITNDELIRLVINNIPMNDKWMSNLCAVDAKRTFTSSTHSILRNQLEFLDKNLFDVASKHEMFCLEDLCFCRTLAVDTAYLANGLPSVEIITFSYTNPSCTWWCTDELKHQTYDDVRGFTRDDLVFRKGPISLRFVKQDCSAIEEFILSCAPITVRRLVIISCTGTLSFKFLSALLEGLECLVIVDTSVDFSGLNFPSNIVDSLTHLVLKKCDTETAEVPPVIGRLSNLKVLDVTCNRFTKLPVNLGGLHKLETLNIKPDNMIFPPKSVLIKTTQQIIQYLKALQEEPVENREAKLMVLGQEGVGKSTLVKSLKRSLWIWKTTAPAKTDGVDVSVLQLQTTDCKVYDLAGDVDYLNTHSLFFSPNCLHLAVFNLSQFSICKDIRTNDQFCRLELWLQTLACQDPHSYAIIVGTHVDHSMLSEEMRHRIRTLLGENLSKYLPQHLASVQSYCEECLLCNADNLSSQDTSTYEELPVLRDNSPGTNSKTSSIPHILGYYEVSGITNKNIKNLKRKVDSSIVDIKKDMKTDEIPKRWLSFRTSIKTKLSGDEELKKQPLLSLSRVHDLANKEGIGNQQSLEAMMRFFHSQGDFLWYEDIPEMKDVVILDPQWLSDQLRTLISHRSSVDAICEGVLHHSELRKVWENMAEENRFKLISLFRSVSLCFSVSEMEDLFPCKLPVGWPDEKMWPPLPKPSENQTSLLFLFSFVPASFFPDLINNINKKRASFASNVQPLYYRFNVVYITQEHGMCPFHLNKTTAAASNGNNDQQGAPSHRIHLELMPYNNSLKVTVRGPNPCCMVPGITSIIRDMKSSRYPGVTYKERVVCPECEMMKVHDPSSFEFDDSHGGFCPKGHEVGRLEDILEGKLSSSIVVPSLVGQTGRIVGETLEDHVCPKLFAVLPINLESLSLMDRFVDSYLRDGYAVHLLCECPGEWHFVASPGFRVGKPKEFFKKYGSRVCKVLRAISALGAPFKIASAVEPHCKTGVAVANAAENARKGLKSLLDDYIVKYPHLKESLGSPDNDLKDLKSSRGLQRSELSRFLEIKATGRDFGPLACTYVDKFNEWLWLCEEHNQKYEIVER